MVELPKLSTGEIVAGAAALGIIAGLGTAAIISAGDSSPRRRKSKSRNVRKRSVRSKGRRYTPHTAGKGKDTSHRRIRYTTKGQPYIIKADGRARFISMKSAKSSHRQKGGRY